MHWLAYVPGTDGLADVGLESLIDGSSSTFARRGPDGGAGTIFSWDVTVKAVHKPESQTWIPATADRHLPAGRYFVGIDNASKPTPRDCQRPHPIRGKAVKFGDGEFWTVPKAIEVPHTMVPTMAGGWGFAPLRQYAAWLLESDRWRVRCDEAQAGDGFVFTEIADFVLESLQVNYRLTREVVGALEMFRSGEGECLLEAVLAIVALHREANP